MDTKVVSKKRRVEVTEHSGLSESKDASAKEAFGAVGANGLDAESGRLSSGVRTVIYSPIVRSMILKCIARTLVHHLMLRDWACLSVAVRNFRYVPNNVMATSENPNRFLNLKQERRRAQQISH